MKKIKAYYLQAGKPVRPHVVEVQKEANGSSLNELCKLLECDAIDIVKRKIGFNDYYIVCDDEGLLKKSIPSAIEIPSLKTKLVGNLLIFGGVDDEGDLIGLNVEQQKEIRQNILQCGFPEIKKMFVVAVG
ncbi:MAG: hypothetical protein IKT42_04560 [Clostridia bacterium]|nr:hypothetical protein [Clostridia bacterium]